MCLAGPALLAGIERAALVVGGPGRDLIERARLVLVDAERGLVVELADVAVSRRGVDLRVLAAGGLGQVAGRVGVGVGVGVRIRVRVRVRIRVRIRIRIRVRIRVRICVYVDVHVSVSVSVGVGVG